MSTLLGVVFHCGTRIRCNMNTASFSSNFINLCPFSSRPRICKMYFNLSMFQYHVCQLEVFFCTILIPVGRLFSSKFVLYFLLLF